ncbi:MAG: twin-arginine translocase TatA/TatE family subunit [Alphaproteobacteria bacterium]|nr:twin-arginine translocase TatA/TatE family subunit [Alphaproteobacteria bacterium]OIN87253.1 MAG: Sec-independent protein translocase TatA [Alphaproteobacteria bacterium CG1_02_46_17]
MSIGPWQILIILVLVFLLFGAGKLPRLMGDVAEGIKAFKRGMKDEGSTSAKIDSKNNKENDT